MRRFSVVVLALALALAVVLPGEAQQRNITWTAGQVGGGWYSQAGGFTELIKSKDPSFNIKVIPGAGIQNMTKLQQGETEIAWGLPPFIVASYQGQDPYKDKHARHAAGHERPRLRAHPVVRAGRLALQVDPRDLRVQEGRSPSGPRRPAAPTSG